MTDWMSLLSIPIEKAIVQQRTLTLFIMNCFWVKLLCSSVLPAWYEADEIPFWLRKPAIWSVVLRAVANKRMEVRFL